MTLDELNQLPDSDARAALERCCGARAWVARLCEGRPYASRAALLAAAERAADAMTPADWLEAFTHHPRIGDVAGLRAKFASTADWAGDEQRGASAAADATLQALADANQEYAERFGHIFIVFATGKSAAEMLAILRGRLGNTPQRELEIAAGEQRKITRLRLQKLLEESA
jgi:2-oxo-4-hydroxy-4-carboxy-5-ureidoimidazoline decarboxylase